ncbi:MAG: hypothetical protein Q8Q58_12380, partial [Candidatus Rokubacteria bacterium]|nr:hypothetical protein [Candidatus Rokubacteria bacterium]
MGAVEEVAPGQQREGHAEAVGEVHHPDAVGAHQHLAARVAREKRGYDRAIERVVRQGIREGLVRDLSPTLLVFGLLGMAGWLYKWYRPEGALGPEKISAFFVDLLERGYLREEARPDADRLTR